MKRVIKDWIDENWDWLSWVAILSSVGVMGLVALLLIGDRKTGDTQEVGTICLECVPVECRAEKGDPIRIPLIAP